MVQFSLWHFGIEYMCTYIIKHFQLETESFFSYRTATFSTFPDLVGSPVYFRCPSHLRLAVAGQENPVLGAMVTAEEILGAIVQLEGGYLHSEASCHQTVCFRYYVHVFGWCEISYQTYPWSPSHSSSNRSDTSPCEGVCVCQGYLGYGRSWCTGCMKIVFQGHLGEPATISENYYWINQVIQKLLNYMRVPQQTVIIP